MLIVVILRAITEEFKQKNPFRIELVSYSKIFDFQYDIILIPE